MPFKINHRHYTSISGALKKASGSVPYTGVWINFNTHYGIGCRDGKFLTLSASDRKEIALITLSKTDLDPRTDDVSKLSEMSRTEVAALSRFEKLISIPPREKYVEIRHLPRLNNNTPPGYEGVLATDFISSKPKVVISVENFDTFSSLNFENLPPVFHVKKDPVTLLYAGDNKASPKAISVVKKHLNTTWYHFGDFDPQGIMIGIRRMGISQLIIPDLSDITSLKDMSNTSLFRKQQTAYDFLIKNQERNKEVLKKMGEHEIAIMQEVLIARRAKLQVVDL